MYGDETGHFGEEIRNMESFEIWYWRGMEKISWADRVRNKEILQSHTHTHTQTHTHTHTHTHTQIFVCDQDHAIH